MTANALSNILRRFVIHLELLPTNLRLFAHTTLFFLITINIALTIYSNIDNDSFSYLKWGRTYILKIGFILFAINKYEWILGGVKDFFFYAVEKAIRLNYTSNDYIMNPSLLYNQGKDVAEYVWERFVSPWPSDWGYWIFYWLILIGFLILTIQIIICWIEYYFLTGFSFIFLPFGALDMGLEYYKNIFKTIVSTTIKLAVMQFWLLLSSIIIKDLLNVIKEQDFGRPKLILLFGTLYVLVAVMQVLPSLTSGLLTGSPTINASAAMAGVGASFAALGNKIKSTYHAARGTFEAGKGAVKGAQIGAKLGGSSPIGVVTGAFGAAIGGSYAGLKYYATKKGIDEDDKDSKKKKSKEDSNSESTGNMSTENKSPSTSTSTSNKNATKSETISKQNQNSQTANNSNSTTNNSSTNVNENIGKTSANQEAGKPNNSSSTNNGTTSRTKENLPNWAKEDYK